MAKPKPCNIQIWLCCAVGLLFGRKHLPDRLYLYIYIQIQHKITILYFIRGTWPETNVRNKVYKIGVVWYMCQTDYSHCTFDLVAIAAGSNVEEFKLHCYAVLESNRRKLEYSYYGGKAQTLAAAKCYLTEGKKLMSRYDAIGRNPAERKDFIKNSFGTDALCPGKALAVQRSKLIHKLAYREVPVIEAGMMLAALKETPELINKDKLALSYDESSGHFRAELGGPEESMTKLFPEIKDAANWLRNMGYSSEAGMWGWIFKYGNPQQTVYNFLLYGG